MKYILSVLVIATCFIAENQCNRIKRQNDAIFFPNDNDNVAATVFFGPPNRRPAKPNTGFGQFIGNAADQNGNFQGGRPNGNFLETSPGQIFGGFGRPNGDNMETGSMFNEAGQPNGNLVETDSIRTTRAPQQQPPEAPSPRPPLSAQFLRCMKQCPTTTEYNPVCGSDQVQYHNRQRLQCANRCGANVQFIRNGGCQGVLPTRIIRF